MGRKFRPISKSIAQPSSNLIFLRAHPQRCLDRITGFEKGVSPALGKLFKNGEERHLNRYDFTPHHSTALTTLQ